MKNSQLILDASTNQFSFKDRPQRYYALVPENDVSTNCIAETASSCMSSVSLTDIHLRTNEGTLLNDPQRTQFNDLLEINCELFTASKECTPYAEHTIKLKDDIPVAVPPYRMSEPKKEILRKELEKLLENNSIEECESAYASPVVLVPKKNGETRLCVNYQRLNSITEPDRYPLPRLDDMLHMAKRAKYMTTLDLKAGYHQISVRPIDRDKTAFITPFGLFRYNVMPFGLRNAPATFQRMIDRFRAGLQDVTILAYLDDLIILSENFEGHLQDLQKTFDRLKIFKLHLNRDKCTFACESVHYLGHVITSKGIIPSPVKTDAILEMKPPKNVKQLLTFLQTCSWFRRFVNKFEEIATVGIKTRRCL